MSGGRRTLVVALFATCLVPTVGLCAVALLMGFGGPVWLEGLAALLPIAAAAVLGFVGVLFGKPWGRPLGLGVGLIVGLASLALLLMARSLGEGLLSCLGLAAGGGLVLGLAGRRAAVAYAPEGSPLRAGEPGAFRVLLAPWAVAVNMTLAPALVLASAALAPGERCACGYHEGPPFDWALLGVAGAVALGCVLLALGRSVGLLLLALADVAGLVYLVALGAASGASSLCFFGAPAALTCVAVGLLAGPMWRFVRRVE